MNGNDIAQTTETAETEAIVLAYEALDIARWVDTNDAWTAAGDVRVRCNAVGEVAEAIWNALEDRRWGQLPWLEEGLMDELQQARALVTRMKCDRQRWINQIRHQNGLNAARFFEEERLANQAALMILEPRASLPRQRSGLFRRLLAV